MSKSLLSLPTSLACNYTQTWCLCSNLEKVVYFVELKVPWEDRVEKAYEVKKDRYSEMMGKPHGEAGARD